MNKLLNPLVIAVFVKIVFFMVVFTLKAQDDFRLQLPFNGNENSIVNSYVDHDMVRHDAFTGDGEFMFINGSTYTNRQPYFYDGHRATDFPLVINTPVLAAAGGKIEAMDIDPNGWGFYILVNHDNVYKTRYSHLYTFTFPITRSVYITDSGRIISVGSDVVSGETIGYVDSTGNSFGNHLDFEVLNYSDNSITDPFGWWGETGQDPLAHNGQNSICLWDNVWCDEFIIEDRDVDITGEVVRYRERGGGWTTASNVGRQSGMRYLPSGDGSSYALYIPMFRPEQNGIYEVFAFIPWGNATAEVTYQILTDYEWEQVVINQADYPNPAWDITTGWISLGQYHFGGESFEYVRLSNRATSGVVGFDTIKFRFIEPCPDSGQRSGQCLLQPRRLTYLPIILGGGGSSAPPTATPRPTSTATAVPSATPTPEPTSIFSPGCQPLFTDDFNDDPFNRSETGERWVRAPSQLINEDGETIAGPEYDEAAVSFINNHKDLEHQSNEYDHAMYLNLGIPAGTLQIQVAFSIRMETEEPLPSDIDFVDEVFDYLIFDIRKPEELTNGNYTSGKYTCNNTNCNRIGEEDEVITEAWFEVEPILYNIPQATNTIAIGFFANADETHDTTFTVDNVNVCYYTGFDKQRNEVTQ